MNGFDPRSRHNLAWIRRTERPTVLAGVTVPVFAWECACGKSGIPVGDITDVCTGEERAKSAHQIHRDLHEPGDSSWVFPTASYDYERAGVGSPRIIKPL